MAKKTRPGLESPKGWWLDSMVFARESVGYNGRRNSRGKGIN